VDLRKTLGEVREKALKKVLGQEMAMMGMKIGLLLVCRDIDLSLYMVWWGRGMRMHRRSLERIIDRCKSSVQRPR
jgi:hypothetical protein